MAVAKLMAAVASSVGIHAWQQQIAGKDLREDLRATGVFGEIEQSGRFPRISDQPGCGDRGWLDAGVTGSPDLTPPVVGNRICG